MALLLNQGDVISRSYSYTKPSPTHPVMPTFCGVRTGNLWNEDYTGISQTIKYVPIYVGNVDVTISTTCGKSGTGTGVAAVLFLLAGSVSAGASTEGNGVWNGNDRTISAVDGYVTIAFRAYTSANPANENTMLNLGATALPYEPYGWAEKITCAGQTTPVYLGQTQTVRRVRKLVLTGSENWYINEAVSTEDTAYLYTTGITSNTYVAGYGICSHFEYKDAYNIRDVNGFHLLSGYGGLRFRIMRTIAGTVADFKSYLAAQYAAGTPVVVWYVLREPTTGIVNEPLCKIVDYADELSSEDAGVTIPTSKGQNTLTVEGDLQPSSMTITYK